MRASFLLPVKQLMALDFPAFDRPANATSPPESLGHWPIFAALIRKDAARKLSSLEELSCVVFMEHHFFRGFFPYIMPRQLTRTPITVDWADYSAEVNLPSFLRPYND